MNLDKSVEEEINHKWTSRLAEVSL